MRFLEDVDGLADFIEKFYGPKSQIQGVSPATGQLTFALYDAFVFGAGIDTQTGVFGLGLILSDGSSLNTLLGNEVRLDNEESNIRAALDNADEYCRLRLPEKYLAAHERALKRTNSR